MKMKKNSNIILRLLAIGLVLFTSSCSDSFFEDQAGDRMNPDDHYKSTVDAMVSMEGTITPLQRALPKLVLIDGLLSDQMDITANADINMRAIYNHDLSADNPYLNGSDYYKVIININEVLANIDKVAASDLNFDEYLLHYYKGALIGQRSWTYLTLLKMYGKAAYIKDNLTSLPSNLDGNMLTKDVMLDTLINQTLPYIFDPTVDKRVEPIFPNVLYPVEIDQVKTGEAFIVNSKAVLGELYLEKNDYANAVKYLKMAVESYTNTIQYKVAESYKNEAWKSIFIASEGKTEEVLAVVPFNRNEAKNNPLPSWFMTNQQYVVKPAKALVDSFDTQVNLANGMGDLYRGMGISIDTTVTGVTYINKYSIDEADPSSSDIIYSRAADLHLLLAEALNRLGEEKLALMFLNAGVNAEKTKPTAYVRWTQNVGIRGRAYLAPKLVPEGIPGIARIEYIEDLIMDERALELAFEGKRWFDLVRVANRRNNPNYLANKVAAKFAGNPAKQAEIREKLKDASKWYLPMN